MNGGFLLKLVAAFFMTDITGSTIKPTELNESPTAKIITSTIMQMSVKGSAQPSSISTVKQSGFSEDNLLPTNEDGISTDVVQSLDFKSASTPISNFVSADTPTKEVTQGQISESQVTVSALTDTTHIKLSSKSGTAEQTSTRKQNNVSATMQSSVGTTKLFNSTTPQQMESPEQSSLPTSSKKTSTQTQSSHPTSITEASTVEYTSTPMLKTMVTASTVISSLSLSSTKGTSRKDTSTSMSPSSVTAATETTVQPTLSSWSMTTRSTRPTLTVVQTDAKTEFSPSTSTSTSVSHTAATKTTKSSETAKFKTADETEYETISEILTSSADNVAPSSSEGIQATPSQNSSGKVASLETTLHTAATKRNTSENYMTSEAFTTQQPRISNPTSGSTKVQQTTHDWSMPMSSGQAVASATALQPATHTESNPSIKLTQKPTAFHNLTQMLISRTALAATLNFIPPTEQSTLSTTFSRSSTKETQTVVIKTPATTRSVTSHRTHHHTTSEQTLESTHSGSVSNQNGYTNSSGGSSKDIFKTTQRQTEVKNALLLTTTLEILAELTISQQPAIRGSNTSTETANSKLSSLSTMLTTQTSVRGETVHTVTQTALSLLSSNIQTSIPIQTPTRILTSTTKRSTAIPPISLTPTAGTSAKLAFSTPSVITRSITDQQENNTTQSEKTSEQSNINVKTERQTVASERTNTPITAESSPALAQTEKQTHNKSAPPETQATTSISMQQEKSTQITSLTTKSGNPVQTSSFAVKNSGTFASKQPTNINPSGGPTTTQVNTMSRSASLTTSQTMIITKTSESDKTANHSQSSTVTKTPYKTLTSITDHTTIPMGYSETAINPAMPSSSMTLTKTTIKATSLTPSEMTTLKIELTERFTNTKSCNATDKTARPDVALTQTITSVAIQQEKLTKITSSTIQSTEPLESSSSVRTSSERKISAPAAAQEPTAKQIVRLTTSQVIKSGQVSLSKASTTQTAWYGASMQNSTTLQVGQTTVKGLMATTHHTSTNMVESFATTSTMRPPSSVISATEQTSISSIGISPYVKPTTIDTVVTQLHHTLNVSQETQTVAAETTKARVPVKSFTADKESIGSTAVDKKIDSADTTMSMVTSPQETTPRTAYTMALGEEPKAITGKEDQNVTSLQSLQSSNTSSQQSLRASLDPVGTTRTTFFSIKIEENHSKSTSPWASETTEMDKVTTKSTDVEHESTETTNSSLHASSANQLQSTQVKYNATTLPVSQNRTVFFKYSQRVVVPRRLIFDYPVVERATFFTNNTENDDA